METVTVSPSGQIDIPRPVRDALNLPEGARLTVEVRGEETVLCREQPWRKLRGLAADPGLMDVFARECRAEREIEDRRP